MQVYIEPILPQPKLLIVGHGRIAETLAALGTMMNFSVTVNSPAATREAFLTADSVVKQQFDEMKIDKNTYVVIATQHKQDHLSLKAALEGKAAYIALIASRKRAKLVLDYVVDENVPRTELSRVRTPAGIDIGAITPEEIALSIMSEIVTVLRGGSGRPLHEIQTSEASETASATLHQVEKIIETCSTENQV
jgi:xanthine dehydrogenase accessory factor